MSIRDGMRKLGKMAEDAPMPDLSKATGLFTMKRIIILIAFLLALPMAFQVVTVVGAGELVVIQSPFTGNLTWHTNPGPKFRNFGRITTYPKSNQFWFSVSKGQGKSADQSIGTTFNDGGKGWISGGVRFDYPTDEKALTALHTKYGSPQAVEHELIRTVLERAIFMSGPTMSSAESYAARRPEMIGIIEDQASNGIYRVSTREDRVKDTITGVEKTIKVVEFVKQQDAPGGIARQEASPLREFGIRLYNLSINDIRYSEAVVAQIQQQQKIAMDIQTSIAEARQAEQRALTAEQNGRAEAAKAKWEQEALKAQAVTKAQQELEVAQLDNQKASQEMEKLIKEGRGESEKRRLIMQADNALAAKLDALVKIAGYQANAIREFKGNLVPQVVMGGGSGGVTSVQDMLTMMMLQNAKIIGLDMSVAKH